MRSFLCICALFSIIGSAILVYRVHRSGDMKLYQAALLGTFGYAVLGLGLLPLARLVPASLHAYASVLSGVTVPVAMVIVIYSWFAIDSAKKISSRFE